MKKSLWPAAVVEIITDTALVALPADLIYLWFVGGWYDPYLAIEYIELFLLFCLIGLGVGRAVYFIARHRR